MKVYFAGPLFTPYVRDYLSRQAQVLRDHGIEVFVPHEAFRPEIPARKAEELVRIGLLAPEDVHSPDLPEKVSDLVRRGRVSREALDLPPSTPETIFRVDYEGLSSSNVVLALLDGTQVDDGTACEIGIFYGLLRGDPSKKGIIGFSTDFRGLRRPEQGFGVNLFVWGVIEECGALLSDFDAVIARLKAWDGADVEQEGAPE